MSTSLRIGYATLLLISIAVAWWLTSHRQRRMRLSISHRCIVGVAAFVGAAIGSKIPFLAEQGWEGLYRGTVWFADGKTILGGIAGGYVAVELAKWIAGIRVRTGDSFALPVSVAVGVGRIGCFLAGCCHG
ncbi:MAG: prolipoprotein diacylglyceryl transferase family protein, partial [Pirellula sp.]